MLSRSKRLAGIAVLSFAAAAAMAAPAHADDDYWDDHRYQHGWALLTPYRTPVCVPVSSFGIPLVDRIAPGMVACAY
ncbi:hypothetical protein ACIBP6_45190 [Nonomuraea terrae]|uniref:hypothetical protein n=1 Tax=Nonomuraea terrae TaxID=2530383 RepID=UPI00379C6811